MDLDAMPSSESPAHLELKRLALIWAQANGYPIVAREVSLPNLRFRLDVGAFRAPARREMGQPGTAAAFECKASRTDLIRDSRQSARLDARLRALTERRRELEAALGLHLPSLRRGDALWPEYETFSFGEAGHAAYGKVMRELATLARQLHGETKLETLRRWQAANLHYLVAEPGLIEEHEMPAGWGLLLREGSRLRLLRRPEWRDIPAAASSAFLHRVAMAGARAVNREAGVDYLSIDRERRGLAPLPVARG
jgi:hypothetical protein